MQQGLRRVYVAQEPSFAASTVFDAVAEGVREARALRDQGFDSDNEKFAKALGRTIEQVDGMIKGAETIDDDVVMKARGIALNRGIEIE